MGCMKDGLPSPSHGKRGRHDRLRLASASFLANKLGRARNKTKVTGHSLQNLVTPFLDELRCPPLPLPLSPIIVRFRSPRRRPSPSPPPSAQIGLERAQRQPILPQLGGGPGADRKKRRSFW